MNTIHREPHSKEVLQEAYVKKVETYALAYISEHYEHPDDPHMRLDYHTSAHTQDVMYRTEVLLRILSPQDVLEGRLLAAGHDLYQEWTDAIKMVGAYPAVTKKRAIGLNEKVSADMLVAHMRDVNGKQGLVFPETIIDRVHAGIAITVPAFDQQTGTVLQPNFTPDAHSAAKALALADLGGGAMHGGAYFVEEGNRNFREMNSDITEYARLYGFELSKQCASRGEYEALRERFLADAAAQVRFAQGRLAVLPHELSMLPPEHRYAVSQSMGKLPEAIQAARAVLDMRSVMTLDELVTDVYKSSPYMKSFMEREKAFRIVC